MTGLEAELRTALGQLLGPAFDAVEGGAEAAPAARGAYALLLHLRDPLAFAWRGRTVGIASGWHVYAGNANGPGGIRARLRHHLKKGKRPHWHVDHLTNEADRILAHVAVDTDECAVIDRLCASGRFTVPLPGFGSSDCRHCPSHLLRFSS